jgi:hypothetical protein
VCVCVCVCACACVSPPIVARQRLGKSPPIITRQWLCKNPIIARQQLGKNPLIVAQSQSQVKVTLRPMISRPVHLDAEVHLGLMTGY